MIAIDDPAINGIAKKYDVSSAQVCIGYALAKGIAVVTKTENELRMKSNLKASEIFGQLQKEDIDLIDTLNRDQRNHVDPYNIS